MWWPPPGRSAPALLTFPQLEGSREQIAEIVAAAAALLVAAAAAGLVHVHDGVVAVDLGDLGIRWSSAQITSYAPEDLVGTSVVCICNFAPRNIAGFQSQVLILGARNMEGEVIVLSPRSDVPKGSAVF